jgi:large subunit ribosomal protein L3
MGTMRPMRVFKGKNLPGHMGTLTVTIQNLEVVAVDLENNCILIKGNIPGPKKSLVVIKSSVKNPGKVKPTEELNSFKKVEEVSETVAEEVTNNVEETVEEN